LDIAKKMAQRFFEGSQHATLYAQFRPRPPQALADRIVSFLKEKVLLFIFLTTKEGFE
jgi:hypothetical protein